MKTIILLLVIGYWLLVIPARADAACSFPISGNGTVSSSCAITASTVDGVDAGTGTSNTATISVTGGAATTVTINASGKMAFGRSVTLSRGSKTAIFRTGSMQPGPIWAPDADGDGYPTSANPTLQVSSTQPGSHVRRSAMVTLGTADCLDTGTGAQGQTAASVYQNLTGYTDSDGDGQGSSGTSSVGKVGTSTGSTSVTITKPADLVSGMLLITGLQFLSGSNATITPPASGGWTLINRTNNGTVSGMAAYWKLATGSEPASYVWSIAGESGFIGFMTSFANINTTTPLDGTAAGQANNATVSFATPAMTTTVANAVVVSVHGANTGNKTFTPPAGMTEIKDFTSGIFSGQSMSAAWVAQASAGTTGTKTATISSSSTGNSIIFALNPRANSGSSICSGSSILSGYVASATDCDDNTTSYYQNLTAYTDIDGDGYGVTPSFSACSGASIRTSFTTDNTDCYDAIPSAYIRADLAHPGQTNYYTADRGDGSFDYDCSGTAVVNPAYSYYGPLYVSDSGCQSNYLGSEWAAETATTSNVLCGTANIITVKTAPTTASMTIGGKYYNSSCTVSNSDATVYSYTSYSRQTVACR